MTLIKNVPFLLAICLSACLIDNLNAQSDLSQTTTAAEQKAVAKFLDSTKPLKGTLEVMARRARSAKADVQKDRELLDGVNELKTSLGPEKAKEYAELAKGFAARSCVSYFYALIDFSDTAAKFYGKIAEEIKVSGAADTPEQKAVLKQAFSFDVWVKKSETEFLDRDMRQFCTGLRGEQAKQDKPPDKK
jgi:hypothetical protein